MLNIGIVGRSDGLAFGVNDAYFRFFSVWGTPVVISPHPPEDIDRLLGYIDVFVLPGGEDLDPARYKEFPTIFAGKVNPQLEYFDRSVLPRLIAEKRKILGICRGLQTINVAMGGTLKQHLYWHPKSYNRVDLAHPVYIENGRFFKVNSLHHQGIKDLSNQLIPIAWYRDRYNEADSMIEAVINQDGNIFAVQWHPEEIWDEWTMNRIEEIIQK